jgi:hypothetical protein
MKNEIIPKGWSFCEKPENLKEFLPEELSSYKGMLFIIASHGFCSVNTSRLPSRLYRVEEYLRQKYGDKAIDWVLYSEPHTNYLDNKRLVVNNLIEFGVKNNLFCTDSIQDVIKKLPVLSFIDNSEKLKKSEGAFLDGMIKLMGYDKLEERSRLVDLAMRIFCADFAFYRDDFLELAMEECLENDYDEYPCLAFKEDVFEDLKPLIYSFPWFKPIAIELSKEVSWVKKSVKEIKELKELFKNGRPFYFTENIAADEKGVAV